MGNTDVVQDDIPDDSAHEVGPVGMRAIPRGPSKQERERHLASGHVPYRAWCSACIRGKGHQDAHRRVGIGVIKIPTLGIDYAYFKSSESCSGVGWARLTYKDDICG
eukprot:824072-Amphidinium_carterae.5